MQADAPRLPGWILTLVLALFGFACSSGSDNQAAAPTPELNAALPDNLDILTRVYASKVSTPPGFYIDPHADSGQSYTVHHVKNTDVGIVAAAPFELCADDLTVALDWSELDALQRTTSGALLTTDENDMYYEFVRPLADLPDWVSYGRVFKCSFVDRSGADAGATSGPAGRLTATAITANELRLVAEYFWTFSPFNNPGNAVLDSSQFDTAEGVGYTLTLATLRRNGSNVTDCDAVDVADWEFTANSNDGQMMWTLRPVLTFAGRSLDGVPEICEDS